MNRRTNWKVLCTSDPIPGDAVMVREAGEHYQLIYDELTRTRENLEVIITRDFETDMVSKAVDAVINQAWLADVSLTRVSPRYFIVATQLKSFADALERTQPEVDLAEGEAQSAESAIETAQASIAFNDDKFAQADWQRRKYERDQQGSGTAPTPQAIERNQRDLLKYKNQLNQAQIDLKVARLARDAAKERFDAAMRDYTTAAQEAARAIQVQVIGDGAGDTWWENYGSTVVNIIRNTCSYEAYLITKAGLGVLEYNSGAQALVEGLLSGDSERRSAGWSAMLEGLSVTSSALSEEIGMLGSVLVTVGFFTADPIVVGLGKGAAVGSLSLATISFATDFVRYQQNDLTEEEFKASTKSMATSVVTAVMPPPVGEALNGLRYVYNANTRKPLQDEFTKISFPFVNDPGPLFLPPVNLSLPEWAQPAKVVQVSVPGASGAATTGRSLVQTGVDAVTWGVDKVTAPLNAVGNLWPF